MATTESTRTCPGKGDPSLLRGVGGGGTNGDDYNVDTGEGWTSGRVGGWRCREGMGVWNESYVVHTAGAWLGSR